MVDEVDRQIQIKKQLDEHHASIAELSDLDHDGSTPSKASAKPSESPPVRATGGLARDHFKYETSIDPKQKLKEKFDKIREDKSSMKEKIQQATEAVKEVKEEVHIKEKIYRYEAAIGGAGAGAGARILTQPLDVLKIRFQLQVEHISKHDPGAKYQGMWHATKQIVREENVLALWKGHSPAQLLSASYGMLQWMTYEVLTKETWNYSPKFRSEGIQPFVRFVCGGIAGCVGTLGSSPFDVIRTRLIGQGKPPIYKGTWHAVYLILRDEGVGTFYKGMVPALLQIAPYSGMQFMAYSVLTKHWKKTEGAAKGADTAWLRSFLCGMIAGLLAKSAIYPLDVLKKRLQVQGFQKARKQFGKTVKYTGLVHCFNCMVRDEGPYSLYKGLLPSCLKASTNSGLNFMFYDHIIQFLRFVESDAFWFDF